ncbi:GyrI-like domain-containing protein [Bacillus salitolerans]|uniref:GyrI-like domain-containing protein n=1 Tax=Bacillus salitolerans TaxID=1437434 RepID=A0ABW4LUP5_9BACI
MTVNLIQDVTVKKLEELKLVGFRVFCPGDQYATEIPKATKHLEDRINEIKHVINREIQYGAFIVETSHQEDDGYWVCTEVKEFENVPEGMVTLTIPSQTYAASRYTGSNKQIFSAYEELHRWMKENGYKRMMDKWHVEVFTSWKNPNELDVELLDTIES